MKGNAIKYTSTELNWIEAHGQMIRREAHQLFCKKFKRLDVSVDNFKALCKRKGWLTGRTGCFEEGQDTWNKGKKMPFNANSARTQFKKGNLSGTAKEKYKPIGSERKCKDGYWERKIHDGMPLQSRWRAIHLLNWEKINGPIPKGHCLKCLDGDRTNTEPNNWTCISRALLPRLAGRWTTSYDDAPAELKPAILAVAKLNHASSEAIKTK